MRDDDECPAGGGRAGKAQPEVAGKGEFHVVCGALCWFGFILTTMVVNHTFAMRKHATLLIDAGYWLVVLVLMGGIIGGLGVR